MSTPEPRPISRRAILRGAARAGALSTIASATAAAAATSGNYTIRFDQPRRQTILGLGFEIQSDSIGDRTPGLVYDQDGGLSLHVQHTRPADPQRAANWLPAPNGP
ncbi:DUF1214 domain-containing protein, partial [Streptomyces sp. BE303]|uniref:DUF1214 domain-containing protein n=1 Tax=Streptomyces sp. BE303 TaxID=3002528 RepID=UPI002E7A1C3B